MIVVGFEPTPFRTGALSQRLRPLGHPAFNFRVFRTPLFHDDLWSQCVVLGLQPQTTPKGSEPSRAEPSGFLVHLLNHSDTVSQRPRARQHGGLLQSASVASTDTHSTVAPSTKWLRWSSGYDARFTRGRSAVQSRHEVLFEFFCSKHRKQDREIHLDDATNGPAGI